MKSFHPSAPAGPVIATVVAHAGQAYGLMVWMRNAGAGVIRQVQVGTHGPNDALRVRQKPLPARGTQGVVLFPHGDSRNGVWICSLPSNLQNAYTTDNSAPFTDYESDWSGAWRMRDDDGNWCEMFPDGSSVVFSASGTVPDTFRNTGSPDGPQSRVPLTQDERRPTAAAPFRALISLASGAVIEITPEGAGIITLPLSYTINSPVTTVNGQFIVNGDTTLNGTEMVTGIITAESDVIIVGDLTVGAP